MVFDAIAPGVYSSEPFGLGAGASKYTLAEDVDGNGYRDYVSVQYGAPTSFDGFQFFLFQAPGEHELVTLETQIGGPNHFNTTRCLFFVDVDVDGDLDMIYLDHYELNANNTISIRYQLAPMRFSEAYELLPGAGYITSSLEVADIDGDGELDLAFPYFFGQTITRILWGND